MFDGHGTNGHTVSNMAKSRLPPLLLSAVSKAETDFVGWKEAMVTAFKVMDKEIKLQENLDCSFSGTTAVIILKQVKYHLEPKFRPKKTWVLQKIVF